MKKPYKELSIPKDYDSVEITSRYKNRWDTKYSTLASRIDYEWSIYINEKANFEQKRLALEFLVYAFDIRDEDLHAINEKLVTLMADRDLHKEANPDYIPGKKPKHLDLTPDELLIKKTPKANEFPNHPKLQTLNNSGELLDVNNGSKGIDAYIGTAMFSSKERNQYRVLIRGGLFQKDHKNVDTRESISHQKQGFLSFVLTANGELLLFEHIEGKNSKRQLIMHSSMNAGAPVIAAGEMQIIDGKLKAITTHSGHYQPTLLSMYRVLGYLSEHDVDLREAKVLTERNPSPWLAVASQSLDKSYGKLDYSTPATDLYQGVGAILTDTVENIQSHLKSYTEDSNFLLHIKDWFSNSNLTTERTKLANELDVCLTALKQELPTLTTSFQLNQKIEMLEKKLLDIEARNRALSQREDKDLDSGRLATHITGFKKQLEDMKNTNKEVEDANKLKRLH